MARSTEEPLAMLAGPETDQVERKESPKNSKERVCRAICAFANDLPGYGTSGVIFIGATDGGRPSGLTIDDRLLQELADLRDQGRILPPPTMRVGRVAVGDRAVAVIEVEPSRTPPVRFNGQVWVRVGPRRALATADEERLLAERRRSGDLPFDARPVSGSMVREDMDLDLFQSVYLPSVLDPEVLAANQRSIEQRLSSLRLGTLDGEATNAGILIVGLDPIEYLAGVGSRMSCPASGQDASTGANARSGSSPRSGASWSVRPDR